MRLTLPQPRSLISIILACFLVVLALIGLYWFTNESEATDPLLLETFGGIAEISAYVQEVETAFELSDRKLRVIGIYIIDGPNEAFESISTTTLILPQVMEGSKEHSFTLRNISLNGSVFTKIETRSRLLQDTIPARAEWQQFSKDSIPLGFKDIAVYGPVLDNLLLFRANGSYLTLVETVGLDETGTFAHYRFALSGHAPLIGSGTLLTLFKRIGEHGTIDVWIDVAKKRIHRMKIQGDQYVSTTTISHINDVPRINPPLP